MRLASVLHANLPRGLDKERSKSRKMLWSTDFCVGALLVSKGDFVCLFVYLLLYLVCFDFGLRQPTCPRQHTCSK